MLALSSLPSVTWDVSPIAFQLGNSAVRVYQLCLCVSMLVGILLMSWQVRRGGGDREEAGDFVTYAILGGVIGGRLAHVLFYDLEHALQDPAWVLRVWGGGLASHGAAVGLAMAMLLFTSRRAIPFLEGTDRVSFSVAAVAVFNRLGNLWNSELFGTVTDQSWGMRFPLAERAAELPPLRHPVQLYQMLLGAAVFGLLWLCDRRWGQERRPRGALTGVLLVSYFLGRIVVEFWKEREPEEFTGLFSTGQWLSMPGVLLGVYVLWHAVRRPQPAGWVVAATGAHEEAALPHYSPPRASEFNDPD